MPSKLDPRVALIKVWLAAEPQLTAIAIVGRLAERHPEQFGKKQHSTASTPSNRPYPISRRTTALVVF
jgi:hypothetical protein